MIIPYKTEDYNLYTNDYSIAAKDPTAGNEKMPFLDLSIGYGSDKSTLEDPKTTTGYDVQKLDTSKDTHKI